MSARTEANGGLQQVEQALRAAIERAESDAKNNVKMLESENRIKYQAILAAQEEVADNSEQVEKICRHNARNDKKPNDNYCNECKFNITESELKDKYPFDPDWPTEKTYCINTLAYYWRTGSQGIKAHTKSGAYTSTISGDNGCIDIGKRNAKGDLIAPNNPTIMSVESGTVIYKDAGVNVGTVIIDHGNNMGSVYLHLDTVSVNTGDTVSKGQKIGTMGTKGGDSDGIHLHLELCNSLTYKKDEETSKITEIKGTILQGWWDYYSDKYKKQIVFYGSGDGNIVRGNPTAWINWITTHYDKKEGDSNYSIKKPESTETAKDCPYYEKAATATPSTASSTPAAPTATTIPVTGIKINTVSELLVVIVSGDKLKLTSVIEPSNASNKSVNWSSNNSNVATVNADGEITAKQSSNNKATITVTTEDGAKKASCIVKVIAATLDQDEIIDLKKNLNFLYFLKNGNNEYNEQELRDFIKNKTLDNKTIAAVNLFVNEFNRASWTKDIFKISENNKATVAYHYLFEAVKIVQQRIGASVDGYAGFPNGNTYRMTKEWQKNNGLYDDGILGPRSRSKFISLYGNNVNTAWF